MVTTRFNIQKFYVLPRVYSNVLCRSQKEQPLYPDTVSSGWFFGAFATLRRVAVCSSARSNQVPKRRIFMKFDIWVFFSKICFYVWFKCDTNNGTLLEDQYTHLIISRWILLKTRNASDKSCGENQNNLIFNIPPPPKIVPFMRQCIKIWYSQTGHRWKYNVGQVLCMLDN